jgi:hypothetical protein
MGDNDDQVIMVFYDDDASMIAGVRWTEARERLATHLMGDTSNGAWAISKAEELLCGMFSGAPYVPPSVGTDRP